MDTHGGLKKVFVVAPNSFPTSTHTSRGMHWVFLHSLSIPAKLQGKLKGYKSVFKRVTSQTPLKLAKLCLFYETHDELTCSHNTELFCQSRGAEVNKNIMCKHLTELKVKGQMNIHKKTCFAFEVKQVLFLSQRIIPSFYLRFQSISRLQTSCVIFGKTWEYSQFIISFFLLVFLIGMIWRSDWNSDMWQSRMASGCHCLNCSDPGFKKQGVWSKAMKGEEQQSLSSCWILYIVFFKPPIRCRGGWLSPRAIHHMEICWWHGWN